MAVLGLCSALPTVQNPATLEAERAAFLQAFSEAEAAHAKAHELARARPNPMPTRWWGPLASLYAADTPGFVEVTDTADVDAARQAFNAAYQQQLALTRPAPQAV